MTSLYDMYRNASRQVRQFLVNDVALSGLFVLIPNPVFSPRVCVKNLCSILRQRKDESWACHDDRTSTVRYMINSRMCRRCQGHRRQITTS